MANKMLFENSYGTLSLKNLLYTNVKVMKSISILKFERLYRLYH